MRSGNQWASAVRSFPGTTPWIWRAARCHQQIRLLRVRQPLWRLERKQLGHGVRQSFSGPLHQTEIHLVFLLTSMLNDTKHTILATLTRSPPTLYTGKERCKKANSMCGVGLFMSTDHVVLPVGIPLYFCYTIKYNLVKSL